jgi:hypothetical protein
LKADVWIETRLCAWPACLSRAFALVTPFPLPAKGRDGKRRKVTGSVFDWPVCAPPLVEVRKTETRYRALLPNERERVKV